jgi:hypothetical protein
MFRWAQQRTAIIPRNQLLLYIKTITHASGNSKKKKYAHAGALFIEDRRDINGQTWKTSPPNLSTEDGANASIRFL